MTRTVSQKEFEAVRALPAPRRYEYFVKRIVDSEAVWSLRSEAGWVMAAGDTGGEAFPVWSDAVYASACATGVWEGCTPARLPLEEWVEDWLAGLEADERKVAVFPVGGGSVGTVVGPRRLLQDIRREETKYG